MTDVQRRGGWRGDYERGVEAARAGNYADARRLFDRALATKPNHWEPFYARAWAIIEGGEEDELPMAEADLSQAIEMGGDACPDAAALQGRLYAERGEYENAVKAFLQAVGRSSRADLVECALIDAMSRLLDSLENAQADPDCEATCGRLETWVQSAASRAVPRSLTDGLLAEILATRAACRERNRDGSGAEEDLRRLARVSPNHPRLPAQLRGSADQGTVERPQLEQQTTFADVGGHTVEGTFQRKLFRWFNTFFGQTDVEVVRKRLADYNLSPTRSILLFGPSGCGKTYIVRAFVGEYRHRHNRELPLHRLRLNEVMNKYVGESEKAITRVFEEARKTQPSLIFADEVDAIGMSREGGQDWRVGLTSHFLQELDRLQTQGAFVLLFGCTNRLISVDMALLRRFDEMIPVELPNEVVRRSIIETHLDHLGKEVRPERPDLDSLARACHGFTPGDIDKVVRHTVDQLLSEETAGGQRRHLTDADLLEAMREMQRPMHVREWFRQTVPALQNAGHADMAEQVERMYGPYIGEMEVGQTVAPGWQRVPPEAWLEEPEYALALARR